MMSDWSFNSSNDIAAKLAELNQWQEEQQKKLKSYQESQKQLLDFDHRKLLNSLKTYNYEERYNHNDHSSSDPFVDRENDAAYEEAPKQIFQIKTQPIKLKEPKTSLINLRSASPLEEQTNSPEIPNEDDEDIASRRRPFLKRGQGLARFRMTLDDFKGPPNIYREKKIKTYLKEKPVFSKKYPVSKKSSTIGNCRKQEQSQLKSRPKCLTVPVNIYIADNKNKKVKNRSEPKKIPPTGTFNNSKRASDPPLPKAPIHDLVLKSSAATTCFHNPLKKVLENLCSPESKEIEKQMKKDDKELKMFEMLEGKVNDSSFCSNSSFVAKFMEESITSTPSKLIEESEKHHQLKTDYMECLKNLQKQYLDDEQIKKFEDAEVMEKKKKNQPEENKVEEKVLRKLEASDEASKNQHQLKINYMENFRNIQNQYLDDEQIKRIVDSEEEYGSVEHKSEEHQISEKIIEQSETVEAKSEDVADSTLTEASPKKDLRQLNQHEAALKIRRKALQDNVKHLLNWDGSVKKKQPKKLVKKNKIKQPKIDKSKKLEKETSKIIFDGALLKQRLEELEKEIEIFRKENRILKKVQKDFEDERNKFEKEKKEFEKQMQEDKEKFEAKMNEEQKKLQRDKSVFEKYCKQVKNQPNKQEREEIANLKTEVGKLTELLSTKESRWGANQARLRNQIKALEKENAQLKADIEKYKKQIVKKVTFDNGKSIETKIIHAINSELGKLKPVVIRNSEPVTANQKYRSLSARVDTNLKPTVRRIKSSDGLRLSVSTDSGVVSADTRLLNSRRSDESPTEVPLSANPVMQNLNGSGDRDELEKQPKSKEYGDEAVYEALFGKDQCKTSNPKILEIKQRLGKLNLLDKSDSSLERRESSNEGSPVDKINKFRNRLTSSSSSDDCYETEEESEEDINNEDLDICFPKKGFKDPIKCTNLDKNYVIETKVSETGTREKIYEDGRKEIFYPNGNIKKISPKNDIIKMIYYNGDVKETNIPEGSEKYYYAETKTWHTTYKNGLEVLEFPNGQTERRRPDGSSEISFPNGCVRYCDPSGRDEWRFVDGTIVKTNKDGHKVHLMPNGQKEIHTKEYKKREYPDGTIKLLYADGTQETRYASGRVRLKDKDGNLVMDSGDIR